MFNALSPELQKALLDAAEETEKSIWSRVAQIDTDALDLCKSNGIKVVPVSDEYMQEMVQSTKGIYEEWYKNAPEDAKTIFAEFMKAVGRTPVISVE